MRFDRTKAMPQPHDFNGGGTANVATVSTSSPLPRNTKVNVRDDRRAAHSIII